MALDVKLFAGIGVFAAVVDSGNFARAGESLGITGSGVSRAISRLEERIGARLLERSPRAVALTEEGARFYGRIKPMLEEAEAAASELGNNDSPLSGRLRITTNSACSRLIIATMLAKFRAEYPHLIVEVVVRDSMGDLVSDGFDAAIRFGETDATGLRCTVLGRSKVVTVATPSVFQQHGVPERPEDLVSFPCIHMRDPLTMSAFPWTFLGGTGDVIVRPKPGLMFNDGTSLTAACLAGAGVAQLLEIEVASHVKSGLLTEIFTDRDEELYPVSLYTRAGHVTSRRVTAFSTHLKAHCAELVTLKKLRPAH